MLNISVYTVVPTVNIISTIMIVVVFALVIVNVTNQSINHSLMKGFHIIITTTITPTTMSSLSLVAVVIVVVVVALMVLVLVAALYMDWWAYQLMAMTYTFVLPPPSVFKMFDRMLTCDVMQHDVCDGGLQG